jgi:ABC-type Fe3+ transport system substrate-binding protein
MVQVARLDDQHEVHGRTKACAATRVQARTSHPLTFRHINDPLEKVLILPEVLDKKAWLEGNFKWLDREHLFLAYISTVRISHYVNSALANPDELRSYRDLINPKWKRKISMDDPTVTGTGNNWVAMVGNKIMGWDFMRAIANQEPVLLRDSHLQATWLIQGKYPVAIAPKPDIVQEFRNAGVEMVGILPSEGTYTTVGGGSVARFKNAPHPNAARVFINWLLTREGQSLYSKGYGWPSRRVDVTTEGLDPLVIPKPGVKYLNSDEEEYILARPKFMEMAKEIFSSSLNR